MGHYFLDIQYEVSLFRKPFTLYKNYNEIHDYQKLITEVTNHWYCSQETNIKSTFNVIRRYLKCKVEVNFVSKKCIQISKN